jgi:predicted dehydrogenase
VRLDPVQLCPPIIARVITGVGQINLLPGEFLATIYRTTWTSGVGGPGQELASIDTELLNVRRDLIGDRELGGPHEDFAVALIKFENGCVGMFETGNAGRGISPIMHIGSNTGEWSEYGMIYGTRGHLIFDVLPWDSPELPRIMVFSIQERHPHNRGWYQVELPDPYRSPGGPMSPKSNSNYHFKRQMDHFVDCIRGEAQPRVTPQDGRATIAGVEAAYESARIGQRVRLKP